MLLNFPDYLPDWAVPRGVQCPFCVSRLWSLSVTWITPWSCSCSLEHSATSISPTTCTGELLQPAVNMINTRNRWPHVSDFLCHASGYSRMRCRIRPGDGAMSDSWGPCCVFVEPSLGQSLTNRLIWLTYWEVWPRESDRPEAPPDRCVCRLECPIFIWTHHYFKSVL